jgi:hypothetical protein
MNQVSPKGWMDMVQRNLSAEYRSLVFLKCDPQNPGLHSKKQIRQIAPIIESFGFNVAVLCQREKETANAQKG